MMILVKINQIQRIFDSILFFQVRKLFAMPEYLAEALDLDYEFILGLSHAWIALKCPEPIDSQLFKAFGENLAKRYEELYPWAEMCQSMHKVLIHSWMMMEACPETLSLSYYSEEGMEASNKHLKSFIVSRARQTSRQERLQDTHQRMLDGSDPKILAKRAKKLRRLRKSLPAPVLAMLKNPESPM